MFFLDIFGIILITNEKFSGRAQAHTLILYYFFPYGSPLKVFSAYTTVYSGTPLNGHPSMADTCDIMDISEHPDRISIDFNTFKTPQQ